MMSILNGRRPVPSAPQHGSMRMIPVPAVLQLEP
jgi:hypothetical protein